MLVNEDDIEAYRRDGFVVLRGVVSNKILASLKRGVDTNMSSPSAWLNDYVGPPPGCGGVDDEDHGSGRFFDNYVNWEWIPEFRHAALSGPLPQIAGDLMGTWRPCFYHEHVLVKEPGTIASTPWQQDNPYYGIDSNINVSLWVPLDPVSDVISLRILAASHTDSRPRYVPNRFVDDTPYVSDAPPGNELLTDHASLWSNPRVVSCPANPGDAVAFHFHVLHTAPGTVDHNGRRRRVVSFCYLFNDARWARRPWKTSPPFADNLVPGDTLDEGRFPITDLDSPLGR
jgi:ectoine hydroxylase-related dioxygenase (phytanoyl-CoA dioxygenase family)